ncbi:carbohydrate kinase family protein [Nocardia fluminea]|uniref:carbohydrate kinase family protein n=1 Tax=Nocardia fluminea TaxID=134984 RepID=UPI0033C36F24
MQGPYFADLVFYGLPPLRPRGEVFAQGFDLVPGGAYNAAMAIHRLGHHAVWSTDFGTDLFSAAVLSAARSEGLAENEFRHHPGVMRSVTVALAQGGERTMVSYQDPMVSAPLAQLICEHRPEVLILPTLRSDPDAVAGLMAARDLGTTVVMDCQDVPSSLDDATVGQALELVDVFLPNAEEALRLTGADELDDALGALGTLVRTVVVKRGSRGAAAVEDGRRRDIAAAPVDVVDTTGAGDCFNAGFVHGLLSGWDLVECLRSAVVCGSAVTLAPGSSASLRADQLPQHLERHRRMSADLNTEGRAS